MTRFVKTYSRSIQSLLELIEKIPGAKILTLTFNDKVFEVDVSESGYFGYDDQHKHLFLSKLSLSLEDRGALIIREFLNIKTKKTLSSGKVIWIPEKNLYGIFLHEGTWSGLSAEALQECYRTDVKSGEVLPVEEGVHYRSLEIYSFNEE